MSTALPPPDDRRAAKLTNFYKAVLSGKQSVQTGQNGKLFIESICAQPDPPTSIYDIMSSQHGLASLQASMRIDLSPIFFNGHATDLLRYLQAPALKGISRGDFLRQILGRIVKPPFFWDAFVDAYRDGLLREPATQSFAWLLAELLRFPAEQSIEYHALAHDLTRRNLLLSSPAFEVRKLGQMIKHLLSISDSAPPLDDDDDDDGGGPGGRHDNDHVDFRQISVLPTADELTSTEPPYLLTASALEDLARGRPRVAAHLEHQFRLLREDMLADLREELQIVLGFKKGRHRGLVIRNLTLLDMDCGTSAKRHPWAMVFRCKTDIPGFPQGSNKKRQAYLVGNRHLFKHQSVTCLIVDGTVVAFPTINRKEDLLATQPPTLVLQFVDKAATADTLLRLKMAKMISLVQIDTAIFSYAPVLKRLQDTNELPLLDDLLSWDSSSQMPSASAQPLHTIRKIEAHPGVDLKDLLGVTKSVELDPSQTASLVSGLAQEVSVIQGPPGTGKSLAGALIVIVLYLSTVKTILVVCFKNHALDQFLEDLLNYDIPPATMVRLGGKSTPRTKPLTISGHSVNLKRSREDWIVINDLNSKLNFLEDRLRPSFAHYRLPDVHKRDLMQYLEFPPEDPAFYEAFTVPEASDGMTSVGKSGQTMGPLYLLNRWTLGRGPGIFGAHLSASSRRIWDMPFPARMAELNRWKREILKERITTLSQTVQEYNECVSRLETMSNDKASRILQGKRIIGCTTTAAAMYVQELQAASPQVLLVEEAGEILESHILTALGPQTKQLILIGDHKQLRPRISNYDLSVEKGRGYDLNRSLFERLVLKGFPHQTLTKQHRMRPEISSFIRHLTYPSLIDGPKTLGRPHLRGFRNNVMFINHTFPEDDLPEIADRRDVGSSSKQNSFEGSMVLKCVRYLAQQGYGQDKMVVLTPYLGQLKLLQTMLSKDNDPILNDLDSFDLVRAGLVSVASAQLSKRPIHLATIDNYQGEESEIVIVTLTRSNVSRDVGFMAAPERLNVLLSRARNALIVIGNAETFVNARQGKELWGRFFDLLRHQGSIYDGFPVKCETHPDRTATLKSPADFDVECPDGGCKESCGTMLSCGLHLCPQRCHQLHDHSKMPCDHVLHSKCPKGHAESWRCQNKRPVSCRKCDQEAAMLKRKQQKEFERKQKEDAESVEHARQMALLDEKSELLAQTQKNLRLAKERADAIELKKADIAAAAALASRVPPAHSSAEDPAIDKGQVLPEKIEQDTKSPALPTEPPRREGRPIARTHPRSPSEQEWQRQKDIEHDSNTAIDSIMKMIGLEDVKSQVLRIKAKIDATTRQGSDLEKERFNVALLGNPGTGKTTIARLYAKFLSLVAILPGSGFVETTGSRLGNGGVDMVKKNLEEIQNAGGGALFVDEAYQLVARHNHGGSQVLDFLLAEMENHIGKIVFIFAGYNKEMEDFFKHNPGLNRRIPYSLHFADYEDHELRQMLGQLIHTKYRGKMKIEDGIDGLYVRIAICRLGRGRGPDGFGNAGALQNMFSKISERQAERLNRERKLGRRPDDFLLTNEDLIGPNPSTAILRSKAWEKLQSLIGLDDVKASVRSLIGFIETNYQRELKEKSPMEISLNRLFLGSPGTGKTSVAKLYGQILADLGILSNGQGMSLCLRLLAACQALTDHSIVITKNPADFIGSVLGQSEGNTKGILAASIGKVLIIDEAYMLYSQTGGTGNWSDSFKTAVIDTIVAEVQSVPGEDRCVLLLGYEDQMVEMFQNVNPGLSRRFPIDNAFRFHDFSDSELRQILDLKLKDQGLDSTEKAKSVAIDVLSRARNRPNFGNAGEVENLLGKAKASYQARQMSMPLSQRSLDVVFEAQDFDADFDRESGAATNLKQLFEDIVGCEDVVAKLEGYQQVARGMKTRGLDPRDQIPTNFIFKGPPGTGKTTTARKMGKVFYDMGFLSSVEVVESSASDLVAQYIGQTGPKTRNLLEKALGKVLFIDEAYRLGEGHFASEAIDELVDVITKPKFFGKVVIILAGYDDDMNRLMTVNTGLSSRFSEEVIFRDMTPEHCLQLLDRTLKQKKISVAALRAHDSDLYREMIDLLKDLSSLKFWGNARDVHTLAKAMVSATFKAANDPMSPLTLTSQEVLNCAKIMLAERRERCALPPLPTRPKPQDDMSQVRGALHPVLTQAKQSIETVSTRNEMHKEEKGEEEEEEEEGEGEEEEEEESASSPDERDAGISDNIWNQLKADEQIAAKITKVAEEDITRGKDLLERLHYKTNLQAAQSKLLEQAQVTNTAKLTTDANLAAINDLKRKREKARLEEIKLRRAQEQARLELENLQRAEQRRRESEARAQTRLREMGVCCAGYRWIKQSTGYRCRGGSHFVSDEQLGQF